MTTKTKRVILDKIIELKYKQDRINEAKENYIVDMFPVEKEAISNTNYIINLIEQEIEFLKSLLFNLFD